MAFACSRIDAVVTRILLLAICLIALAAGQTACDLRPTLRDDYMGQRFLDPERATKPAPRDEKGEPKADPAARTRPVWRPWRFDWTS